MEFLCMCFASRRSADFKFDVEKFCMCLDNSGTKLNELIDDGIHHIFEGAKVVEGELLEKGEVDKLVAEMTREGFVFPMDVWAFDFDRSGNMTITEFKAVVMTALNTKQENFQHFFRQLKEGREHARSAWQASGLKSEWSMTKDDLSMVLAEMSERVKAPFDFFTEEVDAALTTYAKKKTDELYLNEFNLLYADYLTQLHLHPDKENIEKIKSTRMATIAEPPESNSPDPKAN